MGGGRLKFPVSYEKKRGGVVIAECSIQTDDAVGVSDVAWISNALYG